jgi:hypothetical protein
MHRVLAVLLLLCLRSASAQAPALAPPDQTTAPLLSPQAAYDQASAPIDIIHRDIANWSDVEINSLTTAIAQAKDACRARASEVYTGGDLIAYAHLCALGKEWQTTYLAATTYINSKDAAKPLLGQAYAFEVQADLNLVHAKAGEEACIAMLRSVPYSPLTDEVTTAAIQYLQYAFLPEALDLASQREPYILNLLRADPSGGASDPNHTAATSAIPIHSLFESALELAALQQLNNQPERASAALADLDRAMPAAVAPDEAIYVAAERRRYALLGTHFPQLPGAVSLLPATDTPPAQPKFGSATVFLLFPPWCAQCIRQAQQIVSTLVTTAIAHGPTPQSDVHIYALLSSVPPGPPPSMPPRPAHPSAPGARHTGAVAAHSDTDSDKSAPKSAFDQLRKTPTLVVAPSTLSDFVAEDFPFLIATDCSGIIRFMASPAPDNLLTQNGPLDQLTDTILQHWPPPPAR